MPSLIISNSLAVMCACAQVSSSNLQASLMFFGRNCYKDRHYTDKRHDPDPIEVKGKTLINYGGLWIFTKLHLGCKTWKVLILHLFP